MDWLTSELKDEVRKVFEPRYKRELSDDEVTEIANSLAKFTEGYLKFKYSQQIKNKV